MTQHISIFAVLFVLAFETHAADTLHVPVDQRGGWTVFEFSGALKSAFGGRRESFVDAAGNVWWSGDRMVARFDGKTWTVYGTHDGLISGLVLSVAQTPDGAMWFLGSHQQRAAAARYDGKTWRLYSEDDGLEGQWMGGASCVDSRGHLWAASEHFAEQWRNTGGYGVFRFDGEKWQRFTTENGLAHERVYDVAAGPDGRVYFATRAGLSVFDGATWKTFTRFHGMRDRKVYRLCIADDGSVWCTHGDRGGISVLRGDIWETHSETTGMPVGYVRAVFQDRDGAMWFGTSPDDYRRRRVIGFLRYKDGAWLRIMPEDNLPGYNVEGIAQARDGALWLHVTGAGLVRYDFQPETLGTIEGIVKSRVITPERRVPVLVQNTYGDARGGTRALADGSYRVAVPSGTYRIFAGFALGADSLEVSVGPGQVVQAGVIAPYWVVPTVVVNLFSFTGFIFLLSGLVAVWLVRRTTVTKKLM